MRHNKKIFEYIYNIKNNINGMKFHKSDNNMKFRREKRSYNNKKFYK